MPTLIVYHSDQNLPAWRIAILHIGQHKTGSTSIQHALAGYDDGETFMAPFTASRNHSAAIVTAFRSDFRNYHFWKNRGESNEQIEARRERFLAEFSTMLARTDRRRVVISAEDIWWLREADKAALIAFIRRRGWEVRVVAWVREPVGWAASMESQYLRIPDIPRRTGPEYRLGLSGFAELLPPEHLHVRPFDRKRLAGGDIVRDFCRILEFGPKHGGALDLSKIRTSRVNDSLSLHAMKLLYRFDRAEILPPRSPEVFWARMRFVELIAEKYPGPSLDPALCACVADHSETAWLYDSFGVDFRRAKVSGKVSGEAGTGPGAVLENLADVDLSGLDGLLAGFGIGHGRLATAEEKLHRLFHTVLTEPAPSGRGNPPACLFAPAHP